MARYLQKLKNPRNLALVFFVVITGLYFYLARPAERVTDFVQVGDYMFLTAGPAGMRVLDTRAAPSGDSASLPTAAALATQGDGMFDLPADARAIEVRTSKENPRRLAYIANGAQGVMVVNIQDPLSPKIEGKSFGTGGTAVDLAAWEDYMYVATGRSGVRILRIKAGGALEDIKDARIGGNVNLVKVDGDRLYVADGRTLRVFNLRADPKKPVQIGNFPVNDDIWDVQIFAVERTQHVFVAADRLGVLGLQVTQAITPTAPLTITRDVQFGTPGQAMSVFRVDQFMLVADGSKGLRLYDMAPVAVAGQAESEKRTAQVTATALKNDQGTAIAREVEETKAAEGTALAAKITLPALTGTPPADAKATERSVAEATAGARAEAKTPARAPVEIGFFETWGTVDKVWVDPATTDVYIADGPTGLRRVQLNPALKTEADGGSPAFVSGGMAADGGLLYVAAGRSGVRVLERSSQAVTEVALMDTADEAQMALPLPSRQQLFVADTHSLVVLDTREVSAAPRPNSPQMKMLGALDLGPTAALSDVRLAADRPLAYLAAGPLGLWVVDISDPRNMQVLGKAEIPGGEARRIDLVRQYALAAGGASGLHVVNLTDDHAPGLVYSLPLSGQAGSAAGAQPIQGQALGVAAGDFGGAAFYAYIAAGDAGLCTVPLYEPGPVAGEIFCQPTIGKAVDVRVNVQRRQAAVITDGSVLQVFSLIAPGHPQMWLPVNMGEPLNRMVWEGSLITVSTGKNGVHWVNLDDATQMVGAFTWATGVRQFALSRNGQRLYAMSGPRAAGNGNTTGLAIWNIGSHTNPSQMSLLRTNGEALSAAIHPAGNPVYVADGTGGLLVVDVSNPTRPRLALDRAAIGGDVQHVWVESPPEMRRAVRAFAALADGSLAVFDLTNPFAPRLVGQANICGNFPAVWVQSYHDEYAYVSCYGHGISGVWVADPGAMRVTDYYEKWSQVKQFTILDPQANPAFSPANLPGSRPVYLLAATSESGLGVLDISNAWKLQEVASPIKADKGYISAVGVSGSYMMVGYAAGGADIFYMLNPTQPRLVGTVEAKDLPGTALAAAGAPLNARAKDAYWFGLAGNGKGLNFYKTAFEPSWQQMGVYETPGTAGFFEVTNVIANDISFYWYRVHQALPWIDWIESLRKSLRETVKRLTELMGTKWPETGVSQKARDTIRRVVWGDFVVFGLGGMLVWAMFFVQFALPVQTRNRERRQAAGRIFWYLMGGHGTMAIVQNGRIYAPEDDPAWDGPGVALVDVASGFVMERRLLPRWLVLQVFANLMSRRPDRRSPYGYALTPAEDGRRRGIERRFARLERRQKWLQQRPRLRRVWLWLANRRPAWMRRLPYAAYRELRRGAPPNPPMRTVGPGLVFTQGNPIGQNQKWDEIPYRAVDLRKQVRFSAPNIEAQTRDGIAVSNKVFSIFTLGEQPEVLWVTYVHTPRPGHLPPPQSGGNGSGNGHGPHDDDAPASWPPGSVPEIEPMTEELVMEVSNQMGQAKFRGNPTPPDVRAILHLPQPCLDDAPPDQDKPVLEKDKPFRETVEDLRILIYRVVSAEKRDPDGEFRQIVIDDISNEWDLEDRAEIHAWLQQQRRANTEYARQTPLQLLAQWTQPAREATRPYWLDRQRVFAAAAARADLPFVDSTRPWSDQPEPVAADIYRNLLAEQEYDNLYRPTDPADYPIRNLKQRFARLVRNQGILAFQYVERVDGKDIRIKDKLRDEDLRGLPIQELRNPKVLRVRGVKVAVAGFTELNPVDETVRDRFIQAWQARWEKYAEITRTDHDLEAMQVRQKARVTAQRELIENLLAILDRKDTTRLALAMQLFDALESISADPVTRQFVPQETLTMLNNLREWLK